MKPPDEHAQRLAQWLDATVENKGWSNRQFARRLGVNEGLTSRWRRGRCFPNRDHLRMIAEALEVSPGRLLATAGLGWPGVAPLPAPPPLAERARVESRMRQVRGLHEEDIAAGLRSWDARHGITSAD